MQRNVVILDIDYVTFEEKPVIRLFSKDGDKNIVLIDDTFEPYLYVMSDNLDECKSEIEDNIDVVKVETVTKKDFQVETQFLKVTFKHPQDLAKNRDALRDLENVIQIREFDIPFYRRYLIDNDLIPMGELEIEGELIDSYETIDSDDENLEILKLSKSPITVNTDFQDLKMMSFDLEVYNPHGMPNSENDEIIMIGIDSNVGIRKVISTKGEEFLGDEEMSFIQSVRDEKEMIEEFVKTVKESNVDIIIGYNSDNFDFPYLKDRAKILGVDLDLGMDGSTVKFLRRGYANAASFKGLLHIDLYLVMRRYMSLDRYTLERVYLELFGEEKIDVPGERIYQFWDNGGEELKNLFKYSLDDVVATLKIADQILPLNLELTRFAGQPFFDVSRMSTGQQAEWFLVRKAYERNEMVPNKPNMTKGDVVRRGNNSGGYVREPEKGLHENLVQFDFRSLYPSLIISKNISPDVLVKDDDLDYFAEGNDIDLDTDEYYVCPEHYYKFKKEPKGFIPSVVGDILDERFKLKREMKACEDPVLKRSLDVQQQALKRLANTMFGSFGFLRFRWYSFECAQAITAWGRQHIKKAMKEAEKYGFYAIYADTDGFYAKYNPDKKD